MISQHHSDFTALFGRTHLHMNPTDCSMTDFKEKYLTIFEQRMRFPTIWYVQPAKPQISLRICAVWSEPLLVARIFYEYKATDWTSFKVSTLKKKLHRLIWVYTCHNATLLEITCHGSFTIFKLVPAALKAVFNCTPGHKPWGQVLSWFWHT